MQTLTPSLLILAAVFYGAVCQIPVIPVAPTQPCEPYCELNMTGFSKVLKVGESVQNPLDSCQRYNCIEKGQLQVEVIKCDDIQKCGDGKAPYLLPGACCPACSYLEELQGFFGVGDEDLRSGNLTEEKRPKPNTWSDWTPWTECSLECGGGRQSRMRECKTEGAATLDCTGDTIEIRDCNTQPCPVHGGWSAWTEWTTCSVTCSNGTQYRSRSCTNPAPQYGGRDCQGEEEQTKSCFPRHCPVDCVWLPWSEWGECSRTCGGGERSRSREQLVEKFGGAKCEGSATESLSCNTDPCPIDGKWTPWTEWTTCSRTCGNGTQYRSRTCSDPAPQYGGLDCEGENSEQRPCFDRHCPIHCEWLPFSDWSPCSKSCDSGTRERMRDFVPAQYDGDECEGDRTEVETCNHQACPDPCVDNGHPCFSGEVSCKKITDTEFECGECPRGMRGDGIQCTPVNECEEASPCHQGVVCTDLDDGYQCGECPEGYHGDMLRGYDLLEAQSLIQACLDINECELTDNGGCSELRECENTLGSYQCGSCVLPGYIESGPTDCVVEDPCKAEMHNCAKTEYCINHVVGEFHCQCPIGMIGNGRECSSDSDLDGIPNELLTIGCDQADCPVDNCPTIPNSGQQDIDNDGIGDVCDHDADNDGVTNIRDNCPYIFNPRQRDSDYEGVGDVCDNCPSNRNRRQTDIDNDGMGNACDPDLDGDGYLNTVDVCPFIFNPDQVDTDRDGVGNMCDNCPSVSNSNQEDKDQDGLGDACDNDIDIDFDGIQDNLDTCKIEPNCDQVDTDGDGLGDVCDPDSDGDNVTDLFDNCVKVPNYDQADSDDNGVGDACQNDMDGDGVHDSEDVCPQDPQISTTDFTDFKEVSLETNVLRSQRPLWQIFNNGTEVREISNTGPQMLVGKDRFSDVEFNGTLFVNTRLDDDFVGFLFNYQSNRQFNIMSWKAQDQEYWKVSPLRAFARTGLRIQRVYSKDGPGDMLRNSLWKTGNTKDQVKMLYHDPLNRPWQPLKSYRWNLQYASEPGCMRLRLYTEEGIFLDTGCVCDEKNRGGRLGLYVFEQAHVHFSDLSYSCLSHSQTQALKECQA